MDSTAVETRFPVASRSAHDAVRRDVRSNAIGVSFIRIVILVIFVIVGGIPPTTWSG